MTFVAFKLFWVLFQPGNFLVCALTLAGLTRIIGWHVHSRRLVQGVVAALVVLAVVPIGGWLQTLLENRFPLPHELPTRVDGIIVLGGGQHVEVSQARHRASFTGPEGKEIAFAMLAGRYPAAKLLFSGGSGTLLQRGLREAEIERMVLADLGVDLGRVQFESRSRDTWENAKYSYDLAKPTPEETWLLIATAQDMPRAIGCFRRVGWRPIAYPVNFQTTGIIDFIPSFDLTGNLRRLTESLHEWLGLVAYYVAGRTTNLYPGP
jgi:uncharacterized SAM-binding protein YcdF (DUF218 family)